MTEFEKYLKLEIEQVEKDQKLEDTEYRQGKKYAYYTALNAFKKLSIHGVSCSFTFEEVEKLLKTQRTNCVVAVMKHITDDEILKKISDAPMYDYKKAKNKK